MFCTRCGKEFEEDNIFCPFCGAEVEDVEADLQGLSPEEAAEWRVQEREAEKKEPFMEMDRGKIHSSKTKRISKSVIEKKKDAKTEERSSKKAVLMVVLIVAVLIGAGIGGYLFNKVNQPMEIRLCELMTEPEFEGENGYATVAKSVVIDEEKADAVIDQFKSEEKQIQVRSFLSTVEYTVSPYDKLKNGDKVKIIATYDEALAGVLKLDLTDRETTITVKGLKEKKESSDMVLEQSNPSDWSMYSYDFIFPYSSEEYIDESNLIYCSQEDIQWAINEIYARHGYIFEVEPYQSYFSNCEWYTPMYTRDQFQTSWLNTYEASNIKLLSKYR